MFQLFSLVNTNTVPINLVSNISVFSCPFLYDLNLQLCTQSKGYTGKKHFAIFTIFTRFLRTHLYILGQSSETEPEIIPLVRTKSFLESSQQSACPQPKHAMKHYSRPSNYIYREGCVVAYWTQGKQQNQLDNSMTILCTKVFIFLYYLH